MAKLRLFLCYLISLTVAIAQSSSTVSPDTQVTLELFSTAKHNPSQTLANFVANFPLVQNFSFANLANFHSDLHQFALDTDFSKNGRIYVGGTNHLYSVVLQHNNNGTDQLELSQTVVPHVNITEERADCPYLDYTREGWTDNQIKLLLHNVPNDDDNLLMACGTRNCGRCHLYKSTDLKADIGELRSIGHSMHQRHALHDIVSHNSILAFRGEYWNKPSLFMAFATDGRPPDRMPPFLAAKRLLKNEAGSYEFQYALHTQGWGDPYNSHLDISERLRSNYRVNFLTGFTRGEFVYFVTVQPVQANSAFLKTVEVRIGRAYIKDHYFDSYTETRLSCEQNKEDLTAHSFIQAASAVAGFEGAPSTRPKWRPPKKTQMGDPSSFFHKNKI